MKITPAVRYTSGNRYVSNMPEKTDRGKHEDIPHYSLIGAVIGHWLKKQETQAPTTQQPVVIYSSCSKTQSSFKKQYKAEDRC